MNGISIKSHGSASPYAFSFALKKCFNFINNNLNQKIIENRIVTTASADIPLKGLRFLIDALPKVLEEFPKTHLIVIGKSPNESKIRQLIKDLDLNDKITFKSNLSEGDIVDIYHTSQIAVIPSLYEGFGFGAGEAMACGTPLISTDSGGLKDVIGDSAIRIKSGSSEEIGKEIINFNEYKSKKIYGTSMAPADLINIREVTSLGSHVSQFKSGDLNNNIFVQNVALALNNAGLKSMINHKVDEVIWTKVAFNSAMNSVCALLEANPKVIYQNLKLKSFALSVALETCSIAENAGYNINKQEVIDNIELSCKEHGDHKPSMLQDILLKKKTEIDSLNGEVARIGLSYNVKTPLNNALFNMIKAKESEY